MLAMSQTICKALYIHHLIQILITIPRDRFYNYLCFIDTEIKTQRG